MLPRYYDYLNPKSSMGTHQPTFCKELCARSLESQNASDSVEFPSWRLVPLPGLSDRMACMWSAPLFAGWSQLSIASVGIMSEDTVNLVKHHVLCPFKLNVWSTVEHLLWGTCLQSCWRTVTSSSKQLFHVLYLKPVFVSVSGIHHRLKTHHLRGIVLWFFPPTEQAILRLMVHFCWVFMSIS